jgi:hypothetical protein
MLSLLLALPALVAAHGHVDKVIADGVTYPGWNAALKYQSPIPATVGWQADNLDNGFVTPDRFGTVDIVCHKLAKSNGASVPVKPGSKLTFKWYVIVCLKPYILHALTSLAQGHMARHPRRSRTRLHIARLRRLQQHRAPLPLLDQDPIPSLEIRQQPRRMGDRRSHQKQLLLGLDYPQPRAWQLRPTSRDHRTARCGLV